MKAMSNKIEKRVVALFYSLAYIAHNKTIHPWFGWLIEGLVRVAIPAVNIPYIKLLMNLWESK